MQQWHHLSQFSGIQLPPPFTFLQWLKWKIRGGGTVHSSWAPVCCCRPLAFKVGLQLNKHSTSYFYFTLVLSRKMHEIHESAFWLSTSLICYKVGSLAVPSAPLTVSCVFRKFEVGERFEPKIGGRGTAFPCVLWHFNHCFPPLPPSHTAKRPR